MSARFLISKIETIANKKATRVLMLLFAGTMMFSAIGCTSSTNLPNNTISPPDTDNSATPTDAPKADISLDFGVYTADKPTTVVKQFRPVLDEIETTMSENMGKSVEIDLQVASSYEKGIEDIATGKVDFSQLGPASYVEAKSQDPALSILAIESNGGEKIFYGIICVNQESAIGTAQDLNGKSFAFGNKRSTIGRYLSQQYLLEQGINAADLSKYDYLDRHDKVGTAVGLGEFDAGALKEGTFKKLVKNGIRIRELARFQNVTKPWIARSGLSTDVASELSRALLEMDDPDALKALGVDGFLEGSDADYAKIRAAIENNDRFFD